MCYIFYILSFSVGLAGHLATRRRLDLAHGLEFVHHCGKVCESSGLLFCSFVTCFLEQQPTKNGSYR